MINAIHLYSAINTHPSGYFKKPRDVAACLGLTPKQHSSGGKVKIGTIGQTHHRSMRCDLVCGAMSVVHAVAKREPRTPKEQWLKQLIQRRGKKCAAVALANKNVRTAYAMLKNKTEYQAQGVYG